jgi:hypothetical protein
MFRLFHKMRDDFIKELKKAPEIVLPQLWSAESPLPRDDLCRFQLGSQATTLKDSMITRQNFTCSMCKTLAKLLAGNKNVVGTTIMLECGHKAGCTLNIESYHNEDFKMETDDEILRIVRSNIDKLYDDSVVYETDTFTNILLNTMILESIHSENVRCAYMGFICSGNGYIINDSLKYKSINELNVEMTPSLIDNILGQLLTALKKYSSHVFLIGVPSFECIGFTEEPITLKFKHMRYNSIDVDTAHKYRIVNTNPVDKMLLRHSFSSLVNDLDIIESKPLTIRFSHKQFDIYQRYIKVGVPLFASTWNLYTCFIMLMLQKNIYNVVQDTPRLRSLWEHLWDPSDLEAVNGHCSLSGPNFRPFMVNRNIKIGCLDELWHKYKNSNIEKNGDGA